MILSVPKGFTSVLARKTYSEALILAIFSESSELAAVTTPVDGPAERYFLLEAVKALILGADSSRPA